MIPRPKKMRLLQWLPRTVVSTNVPDRKKAIYLTFDDGPDPVHTPAMLDFLQAHDAHATFFLIGRKVEQHPGIVERIVAEGHRLGNHSYAHPNFHALSLSAKLDEIDRADRVLAAFDGVERHSFRPPHGAFSVPLTLHSAWTGRHLAYWSYDSLDYQKRPPEDLAGLLREHAPNAGEVILMHDDSDCSRRVLEIILPEWRADGFTFPTLPA
jgi:peptidoglycan/xylan/chitin deacetylase (PgdA/CDA1 family)